MMDTETRNEIGHIWDRLKQYEQDSRDLIVLGTVVRNLGDNMRELSGKVSGLNKIGLGIVGSIITDLVIRLFVK